MIQVCGTFFVLIAAAVAQQLLPQFGLLADAKTPVLLSLVLYYALTRGVGRMMVISFSAGLLVDAMSPLPLGTTAMAFCAIGLLTSSFRTLVFEDTLLTQFFFGAVGALLVTVGTMLVIGGRIGLGDCNGWWLTIRVMGTVLLGALVTPIVFAVARSMDHVLAELMGARAS